MDFITLEVDGSLANRFAAGAVLLWAVLLSCLVLLATYRQLPAIVRVGVLIFGVALAAQTRSAQREIGSLLYSVTSWRVVSVDFWDGPPVWIAPMVASMIGLAAWRRQRRGLRKPPSNKPLQPTSGATGRPESQQS
jgi:hypothetical protein